MKRSYLILLCFLVTISLTNCSNCASSSKHYSDHQYLQDKDKQDTHKSFDVDPDGLLDVDIQTGGSLKVTGWDKNVVDIEVRLSGRDSDNVDVKIEKSSRGVRVETEFSDDDWNNKIRCEVIVKVPRNYNIDFHTNGGGITLNNIKGDFKGKTMGGSIKLSNLEGNSDISTMGGSIDISDSYLDGDVSTMGGSINLDNVTGNIDTKTMGGSIRHDVKKRNDSKGTKSKVNIETMGGNIDVSEAPYGAKVKTMGGSIHIEKAEKFIDALTMGGKIRIDAVDGYVKAKTMGGDIKCTVVGTNDGRKDITLTSMSGDIELFVPSDFSADIDVEIKYNKRDEGDFEIVSDFDINTEVLKEERRNRILKGTGTSGNGKHKIIIRTVAGSVFIKKR